MKKPDRFTRVVEKVTGSDPGFNNGLRLSGEEVAKLLRAEHKAVVRLVKRDLAQENTYAQAGSHWLAGYEQACHNILTALARRTQ